MADVGNYSNCLYVSGDLTSREEFFNAVVSPEDELSFAQWTVVIEEEGEPLYEPYIAEDDGYKRAYSWDTERWLLKTVQVLSEAFPKLTFNYKVASQEGTPEFVEAVYRAGQRTSYRETEDPYLASKWSGWHECEANDWIDRLSMKHS